MADEEEPLYVPDVGRGIALSRSALRGVAGAIVALVTLLSILGRVPWAVSGLAWALFLALLALQHPRREERGTAAP